MCYWAAPLLNWKELGNFIETLKYAAEIWLLTTNICYIRPADKSILVSTAPISILEALATGACVVIPQGNSYWDKRLIYNKNCIKYLPNDSNYLCDALLYVAKDTACFQRCIKNGLNVT
ncbi:hypothetical protein [Vibrio hepatarius]|uniref:hypothetical protein n=1 Tax=Vibrio hepatarius TaxID=171383 RepID=UPI001C09C260|nr:hypothetical protein [Vibrio hepatarius]MBU2898990.1 hypothetical protein [Vibrio hepatarius]